MGKHKKKKENSSAVSVSALVTHTSKKLSLQPATATADRNLETRIELVKILLMLHLPVAAQEGLRKLGQEGFRGTHCRDFRRREHWELTGKFRFGFKVVRQVWTVSRHL